MIAELLDTYHEGIKKRAGWQAPLSDTIKFISLGTSSDGKAAYVEATTRFLQAVRSATRKEFLLDGDTACASITYDLVSPKGSQARQDVHDLLRYGSV